jgi:hypothetical protein
MSGLVARSREMVVTSMSANRRIFVAAARPSEGRLTIRFADLRHRADGRQIRPADRL